MASDRFGGGRGAQLLACLHLCLLLGPVGLAERRGLGGRPLFLISATLLRLIAEPLFEEKFQRTQSPFQAQMSRVVWRTQK